ncbi:Hypothetical protein PHPALM_15983, partial [Phytophthora palmivora]
SELAVATTELASSRNSLSARDQALANAAAELQAHEVSQKALEDSVSQLQNQVGVLERRLSRSQAELSTVYATRDRFSDEAVAAEAESLRLASVLKQAVVERDRSATALQRSQSQVNSFRAAIARLEGRVSDLQSNHNQLQTLEKEIRDLQGANASLEADIASVGANRHVLETQCEQLTRERDSMRASRDHAVQERDVIRTQVATLASSVSASSGGVRPFCLVSLPLIGTGISVFVAALRVLITGGLPVVGAGYPQFRRGGIHAVDRVFAAQRLGRSHLIPTVTDLCWRRCPICDLIVDVAGFLPVDRPQVVPSPSTLRHLGIARSLVTSVLPPAVPPVWIVIKALTRTLIQARPTPETVIAGALMNVETLFPMDLHPTAAATGPLTVRITTATIAA